MSDSSRGTRRLTVYAASTALVAATGLALSAPQSVAAAPAAPAPAAGQQPVIVGLGDSYMSGEGVMLANRNYPGGSESGDWSSWQTGAGALGGSLSAPDKPNNQVANTWLSVFGDANGYPSTGGKESIPFCDRSYAAPSHIERAWATVNLACSGATAPTKVSSGNFKPGIDFYDKANPAPYVAQGKGQALMLQNLATTNKNIKVVALSIGGNDFGFGDIASECFKDFALGWFGGGRCEDKANVQAMVKKGVTATQANVTTAVQNVAKAMQTAGYAQNEWKLVYQTPPLPVANGTGTKWTDKGYDRVNYGGCGLYDSTLNWIADPVSGGQGGTHGVYARLVDSMHRGLVGARAALGETEVTIVENGQAFVGHRLCEKGTLGATNYAKGQAGKEPTWQANNGQKTEWITPVVLTEQLTGNVYQKSMPLHPNYWGQRALADCIDKAVTTTSGAVSAACTQDGDGWDAIEHRPNMKLSAPDVLWVLAVGVPRIDGSPNVGQTVTADVTGDFAPKGASFTYTYQWLRDGQPIAGATGDSFALTGPDLGHEISVTVTASLPGKTPDSATSRPITVSDLLVDEAPKVTGTPTVGATLTLQPGSYTPTPDSITQQWLADGKPISGATGTTYTPVASDLGKHISVEVAVSKAGFIPLDFSTDETAPVGEGSMAVTGKPAITGEAKAGATLTADPSGVTFTPTPDALSYQWYRNGDPIPHADGQTHVVGGGDEGTKITVRVHGHTQGYVDAVSEPSDPTSVVQEGVIKVTGAAKLKYFDPGLKSLRRIPHRTARYGRILQTDLVGVFSQWPNNPDVKWYRQAKGGSAKKIKGASGIEYALQRKDIGKRVYAKITTTNPGFTEASATTDAVSVTYGKRKVVKAPKVKVASKAQSTQVKVGVPLLTTRAVFQPREDVRYQWMRGSVRIKGATGRKYVPTPKDAGKKLRVKAYVPAGKGYLSAQALSKPTKPVKAVKGLG